MKQRKLSFSFEEEMKKINKEYGSFKLRLSPEAMKIHLKHERGDFSSAYPTDSPGWTRTSDGGWEYTGGR